MFGKIILGEKDANHWEKGDHSGARFDLCTVYGHIHQHFPPNLAPRDPRFH